LTYSAERDVISYNGMEFRRGDNKSDKGETTNYKAEADDLVVSGPSGNFVFRNFKMFSGCHAAVSESAGVLINQTGRNWKKTKFLVAAHGFSGLSADVNFSLTFKVIAVGSNPFDLAVGLPCKDALVATSGSVSIAISK
jgi:hypothetical protein